MDGDPAVRRVRLLGERVAGGSAVSVKRCVTSYGFGATLNDPALRNVCFQPGHSSVPERPSEAR